MRSATKSIVEFSRYALAWWPITILNFLALTFEFDNGPLETWWTSRIGGWGLFSWSDCQEHHQALIKTDSTVWSKIAYKLALVTVGPVLIAFRQFASYDYSLPIALLLMSIAVRGAFRGAPAEDKFAIARPRR